MASIELQRARRGLEAFCAQRGGALDGGPRWHYTQAEDRFEIHVADTAVVRLCYRQGAWHLSVPRAGGGWADYPPRPRLECFDQVIEELEQAPLHVHW